MLGSRVIAGRGGRVGRGGIKRHGWRAVRVGLIGEPVRTMKRRASVGWQTALGWIECGSVGRFEAVCGGCKMELGFSVQGKLRSGFDGNKPVLVRNFLRGCAWLSRGFAERRAAKGGRGGPGNLSKTGKWEPLGGQAGTDQVCGGMTRVESAASSLLFSPNANQMDRELCKNGNCLLHNELFLVCLGERGKRGRGVCLVEPGKQTRETPPHAHGMEEAADAVPPARSQPGSGSTFGEPCVM